MPQPVELRSGPYLFVDGAYFREAYEAAMRKFHGSVPAIDWPRFGGPFNSPTRTYYYDSVDRSRVGPETPHDRDARVTQADAFHARLNAIPYFHVREGFVSRGRRASRRTQKAIDVQLAVDALEHAIAHNMTDAIFIFGDLDFEPLLFSLNRFGIRSTVYYEERTASEELLEAADVRSQMTLQTFNGLTLPSFRAANAIPQYMLNTGNPGTPIVRRGTWEDRTVEMFEDGNRLILWAAPTVDEVSVGVLLQTVDTAKLALAFTMQFGGEIRWE
jgi:NYN domain